jgi:TP901 family phage tail tape measure protein|nr:MAG TPA: minor tail protein [Caudoviricetes sp.]
MVKAIQEAIVKVIGMLDPSVAKTVAEANKKFSGLKAGAAVAGTAIAGATTAAVAFGKVALDSAAKFETGMSNISTLLDGDSATVNKRIAEMGDSVMDIAKKTGMATDDLSAGMYNIVSALGDSKDVANQVEVAAKAAKAGGATTNDAINLLSAVTKGYGDTSGEAWQKASDLAFVTLKLGQTSFPELAANMGKVVPIASALNISQEELFGSFATLTGVTGGTAEVATQMKAVFSGLMTPSKQLTDTISSLGYESANVMLDQLGLIGTLDKLTAACGDDTQAVAKLFSSVEAQTAILALAGSQTENWVQKTEAMSNVANATNNAFDKSTDNLQGKLDKMKQVFETFKIRVGNILIPIVTEIVDKAIPKIEAAFDTLMPVLSDVYTSAKPVIEAFANAIPAALQIAGSVISGAFSVLKTVIPPVVSVFKFLGDNISWIGPIAIGLATGIGVLTTATKINAAVTAISANGFKAWATSTKIAGTATKLFAGAQKILNLVMSANPIGIVIAAVVALGTAFVLLYKKCEPFRNFINGIGAAIKNGFMAVVDFFKTNWQSILLFAINPFVGIAKFLYDHCEGFRNIVNNAFNAIKNIISSVSATVSNVIASLSEKFPVLGVIFQTVQAMVTPYIDGIKNAISSVKNVFTSLIDFVKNVFTGNWAGAWESVKSIFGNAFSALTGLAKAPLNAVISLVNRAIGGLNKLHVSIPDWVPGVGGKEFGINIPQIPMLATGGIATQPSICGEGGYPEYVISTDPKYREQNQKTVFEAANAIGALESASNEGASVRGLFKKFNGKGGSSTVNNSNESTAYRIEFSPVINISGNTDNARSIADEVMRVFDDYAPELADKIKAVLATAREGSYGL